MKYDTLYDYYLHDYKQCKSKKDYKKCCKSMLRQFEVIDGVDEQEWKLFSTLIGDDAYFQGKSLALRMYMLECQGISSDIISVAQGSDEL